MTWSSAELRDAAELRRIESALKRLSENRRDELRDYRARLEDPEGNGGIAPRTIRSYLRAAIAFREWTDWRTIQRLNQRDVNAFLRRYPGYRASLGPFLGFIRDKGGSGLKNAHSGRRGDRNERGHAEDVRALLAALKRHPGARRRRALVARLLAILYQIPLETVLALRKSQLRADASGLRIRLEDGTVRLDPRIREFVEPFFNISGEDPLLFTGRNGHQPLSTSAVAYHVSEVKRLLEI